MGDVNPVYLPSVGRGRGQSQPRDLSNTSGGRGWGQSHGEPVNNGSYAERKVSNVTKSPSNKAPANQSVQTAQSVPKSSMGKSISSGVTTPPSVTAIDKFNSAAAAHREAATRLLSPSNVQNAPANHNTHIARDQSSNVGDVYDEREEEEDEEDEEDDRDKSTNNVLDSLMSSFSSSAPSSGGGSNVDLGRTRQYVLNTLSNSASVCLICIENIKKSDPIWSCMGCYNMFHTTCIQMWVRDGVYQASVLSDEHFPLKQSPPWFCPNCRHEYSQNDAPKRYKCFCGSVTDPPYDPWLVPHSCGQVCSKALPSHCGHTCLLLCHPGPCPPCPQTVRTSCYCEKSVAVVRRCGMSDWSCGGLCSRLLKCGHHKCAERCHPGDCPTCSKTSSQTCACGQLTQTRPCASTAQLLCETVCGKPLSCGYHSCEIICHAGDCGPCPRSGARTCPCSKTKFEVDCTEEAPTCLETCDKLLDCGNHRCTQRCHLGPCGTCREMTMKHCRCGKRDKLLQCYKEFQCETKCSKDRDCGKHQCKRKCCDGQCPPCTQACGKTLGCRQHKCQSSCHRGPCYPCPLTVTLSCSCKQTTITVPCGAEKQIRPPKCSLQCMRPPNCHHAARDRHRCHAGPCPPCRQVCAKLRSSCVHLCPLVCHSAVVAATTPHEQQARVGPWEAKAVTRIAVVDLPCPPCIVPVPVTCIGQHETVLVACSDAMPRSCGRTCSRLLSCSNHSCQQLCHIVEGAADNIHAGLTCDSCDERCTFPRPPGCTHLCLLPCHLPFSSSAPSGDHLSCPPCSQRIRMRCHCQLVLLHVECNAWTRASSDEKLKLGSCNDGCPKLLPCGHKCTSLCHPGVCPVPVRCEENVKVRCPCGRRKAVRACSDVQARKDPVVCDDVCLTAINKANKERAEAERVAAEAEARRLAEELEEFERRRSGRKRRSKQRDSNTTQPSFLQRYAYHIIAPTVVAMLLFFFYYLISLS